VIADRCGCFESVRSATANGGEGAVAFTMPAILYLDSGKRKAKQDQMLRVRSTGQRRDLWAHRIAACRIRMQRAYRTA
jgi:hypothetical protein